MIAVDTNVLVYAHREDSADHAEARTFLEDVASSPAPWGIPLQCLVEFVGVVTHPRIYAPPTPLPTALDVVEALRDVPSLRVLTETSESWDGMGSVLRTAKARGPRVHDARITATCRDHGVPELVTADRRFPRLTGVKVRDLLA